MCSDLSITRRVAAEDIRSGMFVAVLCGMHEVIPWWLFEDWKGPPKPLRYPCVECSDGDPLRVVSVCLPFVQAEDAGGNLRTLDVRRHVLAAVSEEYALEVFTRPERRCEEG